ncbi:MAG TPA: DNA adenine methylase [Candidatus Paceibacterota bacterium]|nr:DNA adenine methylase [Candidatus Paceibacterota bacterium]
MRFIGNKEKLLEKIHSTVVDLGFQDGTFCDFFSGTSNVGRFFKEKGYSVLSSDLMYFSFVLQKAYIENNEEVRFARLLNRIGTTASEALFSNSLEQVLFYLNNLGGIKGFIYENYTEEGTRNEQFIRKYLTGKNAEKIDAQRQQIELWRKEKIISENEYFVLLACLIESVPFYANISGVYAAFLKKYDPRSLKRFEIKPIKLYTGKRNYRVYNKNSMDLISDLKVDVLYLDPPYNERQYAPNYHLLETIARYDNPAIKGITGMRDYSEQKSEFCNPNSALRALKTVVSEAKYKCLLLSYNSEGIMPQAEILKILSEFGSVQMKEINYLRFKSNNKGESATKKHIKEQLYLLQRK